MLKNKYRVFFLSNGIKISHDVIAYEFMEGIKEFRKKYPNIEILSIHNYGIVK